MKSYKAFDKGYICIDYKYDMHKTNVCEDEVETCRTGFHSCPNPHNIEKYYDVKSENTVFAIVDVFGETDISNDDKIASKKLKIIKTFDKYDDLLNEFKLNKNQTIDFIQKTKVKLYKYNIELNEHDDITDISSEMLKKIIYSINPQDNYAKIIFFAMLLRTDIAPIIKPLVDFLDLIKFAAKGLNDGDDIICSIVNDKVVYKDVMHKLSFKQRTEFNALVKKFNEKSNVSFRALTKKKIECDYKINFIKQTTYERR